MKALILALATSVALTFSSTAMAHPSAQADVACDGQTAVANFTYTSNANGMTATQALFIDGTQVAGSTFPFGTAGGSDSLSAPLPAGGDHEVAATTVVNDSNPGTQEPRAQASDSTTCSGPPPPPPPPFCETHPNADRCNHEPDPPPPPPCEGDDCAPPPCEGDDCGELPMTGPAHWWEDRGTMAFVLGLIATGLLVGGGLLIRRRSEDI